MFRVDESIKFSTNVKLTLQPRGLDWLRKPLCAVSTSRVEVEKPISEVKKKQKLLFIIDEFLAMLKTL